MSNAPGRPHARQQIHLPQDRDRGDRLGYDAPMTLARLRPKVAVEAHRHFGRAAAHQGGAPPTPSARLRALERSPPDGAPRE